MGQWNWWAIFMIALFILTIAAVVIFVPIENPWGR